MVRRPYVTRYSLRKVANAMRLISQRSFSARASRATFPAWMARAVRLKAALLARVVHSMGNAVDPLDFVDRLMRIARLAGKRHHS